MKQYHPQIKIRSDGEKKDLINRLSRVNGQISGIQKMVESDVYCIDILTQVAAARSALDSFARELMSNHIKTCITENIKSGDGDAVDEFISTLQKFMK